MVFKNFLLLLIGIFLFSLGKAQLCQGSLGDPIVNITFGAGSNPGPPLAAAATNYQYKADDCPNDGFYTVRNRTSNCFGGWHSLPSDHTGNGNGYFMLVNASQQPSAFYIDTVNLFCSNTTYEFAAWIMNMNQPFECSGHPNRPNLTFSIEKTDGTLLQSYTTGDIDPQATPAWRQYGFFFSTPSTVNRIVLRITNNAKGGCGNDLALDDITFRPCGPQVDASIVGNGTEESFCEGQAAAPSFSSTVSVGYSNPNYQWQQRLDNNSWTDIQGANAQTLNPGLSSSTAPGNYQYRLSVAQTENKNIQACRVHSNVLTVRIHPNPAPQASSNGPVCEGETVTLSAKSGSQYSWSGVNNFSATDPTVKLANASPSQSGTYYVDVTTDAGCKQTDSTQVLVHPRPQASASPDVISICEGSSVELTSAGGSAYAWTPSRDLAAPASSHTLASPKDSTNYRVIVSNAFSCTDTAFIQVNVIKKPWANAGPDRTILEGESIQLKGEVGGTNTSYSWTPSSFINNISSLHPLVNPSVNTVYTLEVVSNEGCGVATDSVNVKVYKAIYVPNAFSPNGDGLNDTWNIPALQALSDYDIRVFDRWGQLVYHSINNYGWDGSFKGKSLPTGVYPYIITSKELSKELSGWVMLVR